MANELERKDKQISKLNKDIKDLILNAEDMNKDIDAFEKENIELKKQIKKIKKELGKEIENNNTVNKEADDLYEKNLKMTQNYQLLQQKYDELYICNKNNESKIINFEKDLRQSMIMDSSSVANNTIDINGYNININGGASLMIKDLRKKKAELENQIIQLKNDIKEQDEDLTELTNEIKSKDEKIEEYKTLLNDEKGINYKLKKKLKELNNKISSLDGGCGQIKNSSINNNINVQNNNNNYLNIYQNSNINNYSNEAISNSIISDNYNIIKCVHLPFNNKQFRWYLFQKIKEKRRNSVQISIKNYKLNDVNEDDIIYDDYNDISYTDFIFIPEKNKKDLINFNLPLSESFEKEKIINTLEINLKKLENKYKKKEKDFNILNINFTKLLQKNRSSSKSQDKLVNTIDRLKNENQNLNKRLMKYTNNNNFIGVSFIADDENDSHYLDDKCFEDILDELDNRTTKENNFNNLIAINNAQRHSYKNINEGYLRQHQLDGEKYFYSSATKFYPSIYKNINRSPDVNDNRIKDLKNSFSILMAQIDPSQNAKITIASILKQLGYNENEIFKIVGNYRGVISMHSSNSKFKK